MTKITSNDNLPSKIGSLKNGGNIGKAMIAAGYSPATAKTPQKLTETKGWKELR